MLDRRCYALLDEINARCESSGYKIFDVNELVQAMPVALGMDAACLSDCILTLSAREFISVKYQDDNEVCLCPLVKGRLVFENRIQEKIEQSKRKKALFISSFFGAFLGGVAVAALYAVLKLLFGGI